MLKYYVYAHKKADSGEVFYIGKGNGRRANIKHGRSELWTRIAKKHGFTVEIISSGLSEPEAFALEVEAIKRFTGLCNFTDGGEGVSGWSASPETRKRMGDARRGAKHTPETREILSKIKLGKKRPIESVLKMIASKKGKSNSPEVARLIGDKNKGRKNTSETIEKMRLAQRCRSVTCIDTQVQYVSLSCAARWLRDNVYERATPSMLFKHIANEMPYCGQRWKYTDVAA